MNSNTGGVIARTESAKHVPQRMCVACRERGNKADFIRVGEGRGAYIHRDAKCLKIAVKKNSFTRALRRKVEQSVYEELEREVGGNNEQQ